MKDRIKLIMEQTKLSQQDFATKLGVSPASLSSIFTGRTNPTNNHVQAVHRAFPNVNVNWLLFGEGEMYVSSQPMAQSHTGDDTNERLHDEAAMSSETERSFSALSQSPDGDVPQMPSMFAPDPMTASAGSGQRASVSSPSARSRYERYSQELPPYGSLKKNANIIDKPERKIKEIRVFYDDGTYEAFVPSSK